MTRRHLSVLLLIATLVSAIGQTGCVRKSSADELLTVTGSTTVLPIAEGAAELYHEQHPDQRVLVAGVGSSAGIESVAQGSSDIGTSSRELKSEEEDLGLHDTRIAFDAIAVIVNPANPVRSLTSEQISLIFQGKITNWKEVGGIDAPIGLVNRDEASGTREAFFKIVMDEQPFDRTAAVLPGTGQVRSVVGDSPTAIGYISLGFVDATVRPLKVDGVTASEVTVADQSYPISRILHFFTKGKPEGFTKQYVDFVLSDEIQQKVVRDAGFLPIKSGGQQ